MLRTAGTGTAFLPAPGSTPSKEFEVIRQISIRASDTRWKDKAVVKHDRIILVTYSLLVNLYGYLGISESFICD